MLMPPRHAALRRFDFLLILRFLFSPRRFTISPLMLPLITPALRYVATVRGRRSRQLLLMPCRVAADVIV